MFLTLFLTLDAAQGLGFRWGWGFKVQTFGLGTPLVPYCLCVLCLLLQKRSGGRLHQEEA